MSDHQLCSKHIRAIQHFVDAQERRIGRLKGELEEWRAHCKELEDALLDARHDALPSELTEDDLPERLRARLMPEGMEWPRFEDGEPVRFGDAFADHAGTERKVSAVTLYGDSSFDLVDTRNGRTAYGVCERVRRPEPPATPSQECRDGDVPDSWERLEEDARDVDYYGRKGGACAKLVRRAKALAGGCAGKPGEAD